MHNQDDMHKQKPKKHKWLALAAALIIAAPDAGRCFAPFICPAVPAYETGIKSPVLNTSNTPIKDFLRREWNRIRRNLLMNYAYDYDQQDNIVSKNTEHGNYAYDYDKTNQLTSVNYPELPDEQFTYDKVGNRIEHLLEQASTAAEYNSNNELEISGDATFEYDDNGNMVQKVEGSTTTVYVYDVDNRLVQVTDNNGLNVTYYYDPFGRRLSKNVNGTKTFYLYSEEGLIAEADETGTITKTYGFTPDSIWGTDPVWMKTNGEYHFYLNDDLGTSQKMITSNGAVTWSAHATAFGRAYVDSSSTVENNLRFPGQFFDEEIQKHQNWYRYYDTESGRYTQVDPIGFAGSDWNIFRYAFNNPIFIIDPLGLDTFIQNRELNPKNLHLRKPVEHFASHTFVYTTNDDGSLKHTYSWGNDYDKQNKGMWFKDSPEDVSAALIAIKQRHEFEGAPYCKRPFLPDNFGDRIGGKELDKFVEKAFQMRKKNPKHNSRHGWHLFNNCKHEAKRLINDAKSLLGSP